MLMTRTVKHKQKKQTNTRALQRSMKFETLLFSARAVFSMVMFWYAFIFVFASPMQQGRAKITEEA